MICMMAVSVFLLTSSFIIFNKRLLSRCNSEYNDIIRFFRKKKPNNKKHAGNDKRCDGIMVPPAVASQAAQQRVTGTGT